MKTRFHILLFVLLSLFFTGCKQDSESSQSVKLPIYFTCDTSGRLEPCGCFTGQFGGLTRMKTFLDSFGLPNSLRLDVGDVLAGTQDFQVIQYDYLQESYAAMGFQVMNMGRTEAQLPANTLLELSEAAKVSMISSNLLHKETGKPLLETHRILNINGQKIGVLGIISPDSVGNGIGDGVRIEDPKTALQNMLPTVAAKCDFVILLAFADEDTMADLANEFYEISLILGGDVNQPSQDLETVNRSLILYTTNQARALGMVNTSLESSPKKMVADAFDISLLTDQIPQAIDFFKLSQNYREEIRNTELDIDRIAEEGDEDSIPGVTTPLTYIGSESCAGCHPKANETWKGSGHSHAFQALVDKNSDADPNCIGCHTIGFGEPSGYQRSYRGAKLIDVGCESCHGPGSEHVAQHTSGQPVTFKFRSLGAKSCTKCHYGEFSRPFDWETFWPLVEHGKENE